MKDERKAICRYLKGERCMVGVCPYDMDVCCLYCERIDCNEVCDANDPEPDPEEVCECWG